MSPYLKRGFLLKLFLLFVLIMLAMRLLPSTHQAKIDGNTDSSFNSRTFYKPLNRTDFSKSPISETLDSRKDRGQGKLTPVVEVKQAASTVKAAQRKASIEDSKSAKSVVPDIMNSRKLILAWTNLTYQKPLWSLTPWSFRQCKYDNCDVTGNRSRISEADLLLFRIRYLKMNISAPPYRDYVLPIDPSDLPPFHKPDQVWLEVNQESPMYSHADEELSLLDGAFNLTSNYLMDSDFPLLYRPTLAAIDGRAEQQLIDYSQGKTKMALWYVSHCGAVSGRDEYVEELQKYNITIDIIGKCTGLSDGCSPKNETCYREFRSKYKFYLAFENSICDEYITEKFWNTLMSDSYNIPVALGAKLEQYFKFSPPDSFLHTRNFTSAQSLAAFMQEIDKDDSKFNSYHKWRQSYKLIQKPVSETLHCYMCRQANEKSAGNSKYKNLSKYWSRKNGCSLDKEPLK